MPSSDELGRQGKMITHYSKMVSGRDVLTVPSHPRIWICQKKLVEKTWFLAIMEGIRCVTYSDDGTVLEMFIRLATMEN